MKWKVITLLLLVILNSIILFIYVDKTKEKYNSITFLNVGQGSSTLIQTKEGANILIDTGSEVTAVKSMTKELGFFDRSIESIFVTHYDMDHVGLVPDYIKNYAVQSFFDTGVTITDTLQEPLFNEIQKQIKRKNIQKKTLHAGDAINISDDIVIKIFFPGKFLDIDKLKSNSGSMVLQVHIMNKKILITGDLPAKFEKVLVQRYGDQLQSDILVAGHHGSKTSTDILFLETVNPDYVVMSAGKDNSYGHPNEEVLERVEQRGSSVLRTDLLGNITFIIQESGLVLE